MSNFISANNIVKLVFVYENLKIIKIQIEIFWSNCSRKLWSHIFSELQAH